MDIIIENCNNIWKIYTKCIILEDKYKKSEDIQYETCKIILLLYNIHCRDIIKNIKNKI